MNRRFALPAAIALTAHAILFLGSGRPPLANTFSNLPSKPQQLPDLPKEIVVVLNRDDGNEPSEPVSSTYRFSQEDRTDHVSSSDRFIQDRQPHVPIEKNGGPGTGPLTPNIKSETPHLVNELVGAAQLDSPPRTRSQVAPEYPRSLKSLDVTGEVLVEFTVDESGHVHNPRILRSSHEEFDAPTVEAVSRWRFEPGRHNGMPVRFKMAIPIVFNLES